MPPTFTHLLYLWWRIAADRDGEKYKEPFRDITAGTVAGVGDLAKLYGEPMALLNSMVGPLIHELPAIASVNTRAERPPKHLFVRLVRTFWKSSSFGQGTETTLFSFRTRISERLNSKTKRERPCRKPLSALPARSNPLLVERK